MEFSIPKIKNAIFMALTASQENNSRRVGTVIRNPTNARDVIMSRLPPFAFAPIGFPPFPRITGTVVKAAVYV